MKARLAIIATHPIQYQTPWFRHLASRNDLAIRVFYLWDYGVRERLDPGFQRTVRWDIPLLAGYPHEFVPNTAAKPGTGSFFGLRNPALLRQVKAFEPAAVLTLAYNFASVLAFVLRWRSRAAPLIFRGDSHRIDRRHGAGEAVRRALISGVFRRFSAFLYVGSANRDYFRFHGVPDSKLFHAPHAVDNERFMSESDRAEAAAEAWRRDLGIPSRHSVILFAGKWDDNKRPADLIEAFRRAKLPQVSLLFVGAGALEDRLRAAAQDHPGVFFAPFQNQTMMPRTYCAGDVFVLPSQSETWGLAVNEAMCMGRAVIVSDRVGCGPDLVVSHRNGLVFPAGDIDALAECLRVAMSDRERLKTWGENGRRMISEYSYESATAGLMRALDSLGIGAGASR